MTGDRVQLQYCTAGDLSLNHGSWAFIFGWYLISLTHRSECTPLSPLGLTGANVRDGETDSGMVVWDGVGMVPFAVNVPIAHLGAGEEWQSRHQSTNGAWARDYTVCRMLVAEQLEPRWNIAARAELWTLGTYRNVRSDSDAAWRVWTLVTAQQQVS